MILDGWGNGKHDRTNAIYTAGAPNMERLAKEYPTSELLACGENVGLPDGQMGNSEVGHLNIGAGRVVYQDLVKINIACRGNAILQNSEVAAAFEYAKSSGKQLHLMGLTSDGGVHSSIDHLYKLCDVAGEYGLQGRTFVHCFMDGRDTDPRSGKGFIEQLQGRLKASCGEIASIVGRYYAMDRDKRWERIREAYNLLVHGAGNAAADPVQAVQRSYDENVTDEFIKPIACCGQGRGRVQEGDAVIFFNFRNDRAKELTAALTQQDMPEHGMSAIPLYFCTMTPYDDKFAGLHILFDKDNVQNTLGEALAKAGKKQLRIAETEKYAHVTFFFSGGREATFAGEERILISSPKVATYDLQPEMSALLVKDALVAELNRKKFDFIALNFANGDMVGHTGVYEAIVKAVKTIDQCVGEVVKAAQDNGYTALITADHGNADNAINADGSPNTAHSLNPVPFIAVDGEARHAARGALADIAPTVLTLMGIAIPEEMTGKALVC
jgi:2,3-bisphosphoglycerate-independent phosphoglycerate mutase